ncbi:MAG: VWA domain-containing protein, partial [Planctomycetaceae bacterium]|nr:VWA domain-containing protein [Planctomycetaceae bacterium]
MSTIPANAATQSAEPVGMLPEDDATALSFLYDMPAWGMSLLLHVLIIVVLATCTYTIMSEPEVELTAEIPMEEIRQEEYVISSEATDVLGSQSDMNIVGPSMAAARVAGLDNHREEVVRVQDFINPRLAVYETLPTPNEAEQIQTIDLTGSSEHAGGTDGAIDRITQEIAASLRENKTLVVWLFDESLSLEKRREAIAKRFESIYQQLGLLESDVQDALKTGIIGYGQNVHVLQKEPTSDLPELLNAVRSIENDMSGQENLFAAISESLRVFLPVKKRTRSNMMLIVVTDERGDDFDNMEEIIGRCARSGVKAYVIGNTSIFGRQEGYVHFEWEFEGEQFSEDIPVDQGPETPMAEGLKLPFWRASARPLERMSSGFGAYTLARLCAETGGIFFVADEAVGEKFDPIIMRRYAPDYRSAKVYMRELQTNAAKAALIQAAQFSLLDSNDIPVPETVFDAPDDNALRAAITEAQKPLATLDYYLATMGTELEKGEKDRAKLDT